MPREKKKPKKDSFVVRMKRRGREFKNLGKVLLNEPRRFPHALLDFFRRSIRTIWDARGGGFYACGYVITFIWLEIFMFVDDVVAAESVGAFFGEQMFEMFFRFLGESFQNMIIAFVWPVFIIRFSPEWGVVILAVSYLVFAKLVKARMESWLFHDDESPGETTSAS